MSMEFIQTVLIFLLSGATGVMIAVSMAAWSSYKSFSKSKAPKESLCSKCHQSLDLDVPTFIRRGIKIEVD